MVTGLVAATLPFPVVTWWTIVTPLLTVVALAIGLATAGADKSAYLRQRPTAQPRPVL